MKRDGFIPANCLLPTAYYRVENTLTGSFNLPTGVL
jgi:hypothetical protein